MKRYLKILATAWTVALLLVSCKEKEDPVIAATSVAITPPALTLKAGDRETLTATVEPENGGF
jgi:uncharacterized protein YjdB